MKLKNIIVIGLSLLIFSACYASNRISKFSSDYVELGMNKSSFTEKYGEPFNKEASYTHDNQKQEKFYYKEELHKGSWFIITTAFTFIDDKLIKQEIVKEERTYQKCDCDK